MVGQALVSIKVADGKFFSFLQMLPPFFSFNLSSPSGIANCTALRAIRRFRRQHCSRSSDSDKFTFLLHFQNFSSVFREILKGNELFHVTCKFKN
jgi:hypothetical protein